MSLEYQVEQLIAVLSRCVQNSAVAQIIRQRDKALEDLRKMTADRDWYLRALTNRGHNLGHLSRKNAALRGVITRMKSKETP